MAHDEVVGELLAIRVSADCLVGQVLASYRLVLQLDVFQLVHELAWVRAPDHLGGGDEGELEVQVVVEDHGLSESGGPGGCGTCSCRCSPAWFPHPRRRSSCRQRQSGSCINPHSRCSPKSC